MPENILKKLGCRKLFKYEHVQVVVTFKLLAGVNILS